ncbi:M48 family metallopeptidase [Campylobacter sp. FMV-PI01]|uniref:M48 family metallopeptidase n=1 Tax=Campylobacter portucalensis TaxID=2608384 RepID=A0A6L5WJS6_9BACT|nr:M48 family metallopeptidase [Campylobacter portucalensis]MSN96103.1 M48 family metallopeptidase [Campylobacter portucalensis]
MLIILISFFVVYAGIKVTLELIEIKFINSELLKEPVILEKDAFIRAGEISIINRKFEIFSLLYELIFIIIWLSFGLKFLYEYIVKNGSILENLTFVMSFVIISSFINLPLEIYSKFVKDKKFGFSNLDFKTFLLDTLKSLFLMLVFGSLFVYLLLVIINFLGNLWWFWASIISFMIILFMNFIYPTIIAPIFNKITKLEDVELNGSICELLQKCGFKSNGVFVVDASKRDNRLNAYFGGLGSAKRVVLFDTIIQKLTKDEILAVLGHELGHFKNKDIIKILIFAFIIIFLVFLILGNLPLSVFEAVGIDKNGGSIIVMISILSSLISFIITPIQSFLSRKREFAADKFGALVKDKISMSNALIKLGHENKAFPKSSKIYSSFYHSHPSLYERICELK